MTKGEKNFKHGINFHMFRTRAMTFRTVPRSKTAAPMGDEWRSARVSETILISRELVVHDPMEADYRLL